ncbi:MAG: Na(+)-translocating NADH-quinone reductase subunit C [Planctomycetaceae bacterium]|nr:Na(+)-translocating NADH-quinone reductase subunit C [Planctomycetaceae bacterium]
MSRESPIRTITVAATLCVVCSLMVSAAAVSLRSMQEANKLALMQKEILKAAGIYDESDEASPVSEQFKVIDSKLIDLDTGLEVDDSLINPETYDSLKAANDPEMSVEIPSGQDVAGIGRREKYAFVYFVQNESGDGFSKIILPVYGKGLWSTMYGYLALENDLKTVAGITFYKHGETPGLGGEVDNPDWKQSWVGKQAREIEDGELVPAIHVIKGGVNESSPEAEHQVDALSGATITSNGVENTIDYWLGDHAFKIYLNKRLGTELEAK